MKRSANVPFLKPGMFLQERDESLMNPNTGDMAPGDIVLHAIEDAGWKRLGLIPTALRDDKPDDSYFWGVTPVIVAALSVWRDVPGLPPGTRVIVKLDMANLPFGATGYFSVDGWQLTDFILTHNLVKHSKIEYEGTDPPSGLMSLEEMREHFEREQRELEKQKLEIKQFREMADAIHAKLKWETENG